MATQKGTLRAVTELVKDSVGPGRVTYLCAFDFPAYTGASDSGQIDAIAAAISAKCRDGVTRTLLSSCVPTCVGRGKDTAGQDVFIGAVTISTNDLTFNLTASDGTTELTSATASSGVQLVVTVAES